MGPDPGPGHTRRARAGERVWHVRARGCARGDSSSKVCVCVRVWETSAFWLTSSQKKF